jgi:uncharacterized low-complexity protein
MRKLTLTLAAAALVLGTLAVQANAQNQNRGAAVFKNATPIVTLAACNGRTGHCGCGAGWVSACGNQCCGCRRCR